MKCDVIRFPDVKGYALVVPRMAQVVRAQDEVGSIWLAPSASDHSFGPHDRLSLVAATYCTTSKYETAQGEPREQSRKPRCLAVCKVDRRTDALDRHGQTSSA